MQDHHEAMGHNCACAYSCSGPQNRTKRLSYVTRRHLKIVFGNRYKPLVVPPWFPVNISYNWSQHLKWEKSRARDSLAFI